MSERSDARDYTPEERLAQKYDRRELRARRQAALDQVQDLEEKQRALLTRLKRVFTAYAKCEAAHRTAQVQAHRYGEASKIRRDLEAQAGPVPDDIPY